MLLLDVSLALGFIYGYHVVWLSPRFRYGDVFATMCEGPKVQIQATAPVF